MTTQHHPAPAEAAAPSATRKTWWALAALVFVGLLVYVGFHWKQWQWRLWVNGADKREYWDKIAEEQDPGIIPEVVAGFRDPDKADVTRTELGNLLLKKNRLAEVEAALKDPDLDVRRLGLIVLARRDYFHRQYAEDPGYGVEKTLLQWLSDRSAKNRLAALQIVPKVWSPPGAAPEAVRVLTDIVTAPPATGSDDEASLRGAAARELQAYHDCAAGARLLTTALAEKSAEAKKLEIQAVVQMYDATGGATGTCAKELPEDSMRRLVESALAEEGSGQWEKALRLLAMGYMGSHSSWGTPSVETLRKVLALPAGSARDVERRTALDALVMLKDEPTLRDAPKYFHDPYAGIRSSAVQNVVHGAGGLEAKHFESALVGYVREEPAASANQSAAFRLAIQKLAMFGGHWLGFPARLREKGPALEPEVEKVLVAIFLKQEVDGTTRASVAEAWWDWLAHRNGLEKPEDVDAARKARDAFWAKASVGDVPGAKAVLESAPAKDKPLWGYEQGWLLAHS